MFAVPILLFGVLSWTKPSWRIFWMTTEHVHPPDKSSGITCTWPKEQIQKKNVSSSKTENAIFNPHTFMKEISAESI